MTTPSFTNDKAFRTAYAKATMMGMVEKFVEEFDLASNRDDVFCIFTQVDPLKYQGVQLFKFVFTRKTGKLVSVKESN